MHFVYILYNPSINLFYIGESATPSERLQHDRAGHQRYTRRAADWIQVFQMEVPSRRDALEIERRIKRSRSRKSIVHWIRGPDNQVPSAGWSHMVW